MAQGRIMSSRRQRAGPRHGCRGSVGGGPAPGGAALAAASAEFAPAGWNAKLRSGNGLRAELPDFGETYTLPAAKGGEYCGLVNGAACSATGGAHALRHWCGVLRGWLAAASAMRSAA